MAKSQLVWKRKVPHTAGGGLRSLAKQDWERKQREAAEKSSQIDWEDRRTRARKWAGS